MSFFFVHCVSAKESDIAELSEMVTLAIDNSKPLNLENIGLKQHLNFIDFNQGNVDAVIEMWRRGKRDYLELVWWRQYDRITRIIILSLFYTQSKMTISNAPTFFDYLQRFSKEEILQREEELNFVVENKNRLKNLVNRAIQRR